MNWIFRLYHQYIESLMSINVLYITLEMAEERIAERIDANLLDVTLDEILVHWQYTS